MARTPNTKLRQAKETMILEGARRVFCRKGFLGVTMKDIIEECGISRGGIYLYFQSVDEIFWEAVKRRRKSRFETIRLAVEQNQDFFRLLDTYFEMQKNRLLHMEDSLLRAMYEYLFTHNDSDDVELRTSQLDNIRFTVQEILLLGVRQGAIANRDIAALSESFMFIIEGLNVLALLGGLTESHIDTQLRLMKTMLPRKDDSA